MGQYYSRICIKVRGTSVWKRLYDIKTQNYNLGASGEEVFSSKKKMIVISDWSCDEAGVLKLVKDVAKRLENDGIVVADTTNINVNPYEYGVYYLGGKVHDFLYDDTSDKCEMFNDTNIKDISAWIGIAECPVSASEKRMAEEFGVKVNVRKEITNTPKADYNVQYYIRFTNSTTKEVLLKTIPFLETERFLSEEIDKYKQRAFSIFDERESDVSFVIPKCYKSEICNYIESVSGILKKDGIVISYAWNYKDENISVSYYLGGDVITFECVPGNWGYDNFVKELKKDEVLIDEIINIREITKVLGSQCDKLTENEKNILKSFQ